jgi:hypothetical protein
MMTYFFIYFFPPLITLFSKIKFWKPDEYPLFLSSILHSILLYHKNKSIFEIFVIQYVVVTNSENFTSKITHFEKFTENVGILFHLFGVKHCLLWDGLDLS